LRLACRDEASADSDWSQGKRNASTMRAAPGSGSGSAWPQ
jgi:hypothetical protein